MTLCPINGLAFIKPYLPPIEQLSAGGIVMPAHSSISPEGHVLFESHNPLYASQGEVIAVDPRVDADVEVGDWVVIPVYAGRVVTVNRTSIIAIHHSDILAVVEEEHHGPELA